MNQHTLIVTAANRAGVLARVVGLLSARDIPFEHILGGEAERPDLYRIHLSVQGEREHIRKICRQLEKLIDIVKVTAVEDGPSSIVREYVLATVSARRRPELSRLIERFRANLVEETRRFVTVDLVGPARRIDRFLNSLGPFGLKEYARSGRLAVLQPNRKEQNHVRTNVFRQGRRSQFTEVQKSGRHRLRQPGPRPSSESA
jgi:acetolactate synthase-1/3 small subunit